MNIAFDLDAYLERIRYSGSRVPSLDTLCELHLRHAQAIPFENLNPLLRVPVRLDMQSLQQKLVRERRGGYCFEQNLLLSHALTTLGFEVTWLAARVLWNAPEGALTARGHMLLLVDLDNRAYIADVGFGGLTLTGPLRLEHATRQATPHEAFRLMKKGNAFVMQAEVEDAWQALYRFDLEEQVLADYEVASWYLSNHPDSHFVTGLVAARPETGRRYALRNNELTVHHLKEGTERRRLASAADICAVLTNLFHVNLPDAPEVRTAFDRLLARAA